MSETTLEMVQPEAAVKPYTFRPLEASDMFLMSKIIGKIGVNEFSACFEKDSVKQMISNLVGKENSEESTTLAGASVILEIANVVFSNLPKCETEIYQMLSRTSNLTQEAVMKLGFVTFTEMLIDFVKKEEFVDFIRVVSRLFK